MIRIHELEDFDNPGRVHSGEGARFHDDWQKPTVYRVLPQRPGTDNSSEEQLASLHALEEEFRTHFRDEVF